MGTSLVGGPHQGLNLPRRQEIRRGTAGGRDNVVGRDFGLGERGPQIRQEAPHHTQTLGGATRPALRRGGAGPIDSQLRPDGAGGLHVFHIIHEVPEQGPCGAHLKPEGLTHAEICIEVEMEIGSIHCAAPIQGSAIAARAGRSSLA